MPKYSKVVLDEMTKDQLWETYEEEFPKGRLRRFNFKGTEVKGWETVAKSALLRIPKKTQKARIEALPEDIREYGKKGITTLRADAKNFGIKKFTNMPREELIRKLVPFYEMSKTERSAFERNRDEIARLRPQLLQKIAKTLQERYPLAKVFYKRRNGADTLNITTIGGKPANNVAGKIIRKEYDDEQDYEARLAGDRKQFEKAVVEDVVAIVNGESTQQSREQPAKPAKKKLVRKAKSLDTYIQEIDAMEEEDGKFKPRELFNEIVENYTTDEVEAVERDLDARFGNTNKDYYRIGDNAKGNRSPVVKKNGEFASAPTGMNGRNLYIILQELKRGGVKKAIKEI